MATNYVALRITATDDAKPDLTELQARLDELRDRVATARAEVDDAQADVVLADLDAKLDMASKKVVNPKIDMSGASRAAAQVTAVEASLDDLDAKAAAAAEAAAARETAAAQESADAQVRAAQEAAAAEIASYREAAAAAETAAGEASAAQEGAAAKSSGAAEKSGAGWAAAGGKAKMAMLGIGIGAAVAIKGASDFQAQTTRLVTSAGEQARNLGLVRQGMLGIAASTGTSTAQMASGMYTVESAGFHGAAALTVLKAASQGAKDEGAQLAVVSNAVTDALVDFHQPASAASNVTSQLIAAVSHGKTTFEEFSGSMSNVLPLASAMHLKLSDVTGVLAEMTAHGMSAQQASQDEANAMRKMMAPSAGMVKEYKALGLSAAEVHAKLGTAGLGGTMQWLSETAKKGSGAIGQNYTQAMYKLMGTAPGLAVALMTTGENAKATNAAIKGIAGASADAKGNVDGFSTVSQTMAFKLAAAKESIMAAGISLGQVLLPAAAAVITPLTKMLQAIAGNKAESIAFAIVIGGVVAGALGGKLAKALKDTEEGIKYAGDKLGWLGKKFGLLADEQAKGAAKGAAATKTASAESAASAEGAAAAEEGAAGEVAAANETAAAESSSSWASSAASGIASAAKWVAEGTAKVAVYVAKNIAGAATTLAGWVATGAQVAAQGVMWVASGIAKVAVYVASNVAGAVASAAAWMIANAAMLLGIGLVIAAVVIAVVEIVKHWKQISAEVARVWDDVYSFISKIVSDVISWVKGHWPLLLGILLGPIAMAAALIYMHWRGVVTGAEWMFHQVVSFFTQLPGRILSALGDMGHLLYNAGAKIIQGLISGITSQIGQVGSAISNIAGEIKDHLPFSPAKKGPLSGSGAPANSGASIVRQVAQGISAGIPGVANSAKLMAFGVMQATDAAKLHEEHVWHVLHMEHEQHLKDMGLLPGSGTASLSRLALATAGAGGAGGGTGVLEVRLVIDASDSKFMEALMGKTRIMGGDPAMFQRKVVFR